MYIYISYHHDIHFTCCFLQIFTVPVAVPMRPMDNPRTPVISSRLPAARYPRNVDGLWLI